MKLSYDDDEPPFPISVSNLQRNESRVAIKEPTVPDKAIVKKLTKKSEASFNFALLFIHVFI